MIKQFTTAMVAAFESMTEEDRVKVCGEPDATTAWVSDGSSPRELFEAGACLVLEANGHDIWVIDGDDEKQDQFFIETEKFAKWLTVVNIMAS